MKKSLYAFLIVCLLVSLCACSAPDPLPAPSPTPTSEPIDEDATMSIRNALPYYAECDFKRDDDGDVAVTVKISSDEISKYGELIYKTLKTIDAKFSEYNATILFWSNKDIPISYRGTLSSGFFNDKRSGEMKVTSISSPEDLVAFFPTLRFLLNAEENGVSIEEYDRYNAVIDALNDTSRTEQDILEEIAPKYGMTAAELEAWMYEMMDKIY